MGFILTLLIFIGILGLLGQFCSYPETRKSNIKFAMGWGSALSIVICLIILGNSYISYVDLKQSSITIQQYKSSMHLYIEHANAPSGVKGGQLVSDVTDQKYENYQRNLRYYVTKYRDKVSTYNTILEGKRFLNNSWYWGALIFCPDIESFKIIDLS